MNAGSGERSQDGVKAVDRGDAKGGSCGGSRTLTRGEADEVSAHSADGHRHSQARSSAGGEVADHGGKVPDRGVGRPAGSARLGGPARTDGSQRS